MYNKDAILDISKKYKKIINRKKVITITEEESK